MKYGAEKDQKKEEKGRAACLRTRLEGAMELKF
jgi:hypothetical protein